MYPRNALQAASNPKSHVLRQIEYFYHTRTCHDPAHAFTDALPTSIGIQGRVGQRNAPTVLNALYNKFQFWDGRAKTLEEQAALPIVNPSEMGQPSLKVAVDRIAVIPEYQQTFQSVFGHPPARYRLL